MTLGKAKMRAGWSVGLDVLAQAARRATGRISSYPRESAEPRDAQSRAYVSLRHPSLQHSTPVTSVRPSPIRNVAQSPPDYFDIGTFLRELDALRRRMNEVASAFEQAREKYGAAAMAGERHHTSIGDLAAMNDALACAVKRLGKSHY
jgi:hypothetical protein